MSGWGRPAEPLPITREIPLRKERVELAGVVRAVEATHRLIEDSPRPLTGHLDLLPESAFTMPRPWSMRTV